MPTTPDEFVAALFVVIVLTALLIVGAGRVVVWAASRLERGHVSTVSRVQVRDYVAQEPERTNGHGAPFSPFEQAEQPPFVQGVQPPNGAEPPAEDITRIDSAARVLAAGLTGEAAIIELLFDGVKRGGSKRYATIRDGVRLLAASKYGWKQPEPAASAPEAPRLIPISDGKGGYIEV